MANRVLLDALPKYPVCSVRELVTATPSEHSKPSETHGGNRRVLKLANKREIMVVLHPLSGEVFAMDRFCYHEGYPLEGGDMEDIVAVELHHPPGGGGGGQAPNGEQQKVEGSHRGEVKLPVKRSSGPLKYKKEEDIRSGRKREGHETDNSEGVVAAAAGAGAASASPATPLEAGISPLKVRPGLLEVDYEDPSKYHDDDTYEFPIITCTLHNRIFDLRTGDMITRHVEAQRDGYGDNKCLVSESTGCHQRVHPVSIEKVGGNNDDDGDDGVIFVHDTIGFSVPMRRPGAKVNMQDRSHLMFLANKKVISDRENRAVEPAASPAAS